MKTLSSLLIFALLAGSVPAAVQAQADNAVFARANPDPGYHMTYDDLPKPSAELLAEREALLVRLGVNPAPATDGESVGVTARVDVNTRSRDVCRLSRLRDATGEQIEQGVCSQNVMGEIPNENNMLSTIITTPANEANIRERTTFTVVTRTNNIAEGFFSNPDTQYNAFPQTIAANGDIQGHTHVTIQRIREGDAPNPREPAFFDGIEEAANRNNELTTTVQGGLPAGRYRACTMVSSFSHQPVVMPIARRGAQDDCVRFNIRRR